ncbi:hypothetical protein E4L96_17515 [Massilia arenosa]|uniref:SGNH/GDSL hydrolase family protein n=1 Tax=Zemynaea arenosa TaxID=2561931 RepID=A0A4Y9S5L5_9BURK|nr:hypothetical protein [Massilia arenosa]TFW15763.1 hypothetical protein E4L96_17515 [Massilia arenosa]
MRSYLWTVCGLSALAVGGAAVANYVVDPYVTHQWDNDTVQRLRPAREKMSAWGKTYAVAAYRPSVLYLGNSRTELGLPAPLPAFGKAPVFNAALSGASLGDAVAMAQHALMVSRPRTVVWGVDAPSFSLVLGTQDFDRQLVATSPDYFPRRALLDLRRAVSYDMTEDTLRVLRGTFGSVCRSNLAFHGQRDTSCILDHMHGWGGTAAAVLPRLHEFVRGEGPTPDALQAFIDTVTLLCGTGAQLRIYLNPTHASMHEALYQRGKWAALEQWQRGLTAAIDQARAGGCNARLYDFSGYNSVTTEPLPQASGAKEMIYYWEPSHYRDNVGRMILASMFGGDTSAVPTDFGIELSLPMLDRFQAVQRTARDEYRRAHPVEAALARAVAESEAAAARRAQLTQRR